MTAPRPLDRTFLEGFVGAAIDRGLTDRQIAELMYKAAAADPAVRAAFEKEADGPALGSELPTPGAAPQPVRLVRKLQPPAAPKAPPSPAPAPPGSTISRALAVSGRLPTQSPAPATTPSGLDPRGLESPTHPLDLDPSRSGVKSSPVDAPLTRRNPPYDPNNPDHVFTSVRNRLNSRLDRIEDGLEPFELPLAAAPSPLGAAAYLARLGGRGLGYLGRLGGAGARGAWTATRVASPAVLPAAMATSVGLQLNDQRRNNADTQFGNAANNLVGQLLRPGGSATEVLAGLDPSSPVQPYAKHVAEALSDPAVAEAVRLRPDLVSTSLARARAAGNWTGQDVAADLKAMVHGAPQGPAAPADQAGERQTPQPLVGPQAPPPAQPQPQAPAREPAPQMLGPTQTPPPPGQPAPQGQEAPSTLADLFRRPTGPQDLARSLGLDNPNAVQALKDPKALAEYQRGLDGMWQTFQGNLGRMPAEQAAAHAKVLVQAQALVARTKSGLPLPELARRLEALRSDDPVARQAWTQFQNDPEVQRFAQAHGGAAAPLMNLWQSLNEGPLKGWGQTMVYGGLALGVLGLLSALSGGGTGASLGLLGAGVGLGALALGQSPGGLSGAWSALQRAVTGPDAPTPYDVPGGESTPPAAPGQPNPVQPGPTQSNPLQALAGQVRTRLQAGDARGGAQVVLEAARARPELMDALKKMRQAESWGVPINAATVGPRLQQYGLSLSGEELADVLRVWPAVREGLGR